MDYFQGVVTEFLRADRTVLVNTECLIQLDAADVPGKGRHWYCDAVAVNFREGKVYLCEVTYSASLQSLSARLQAWVNHWPAVCEALVRDCGVPREWPKEPWVFIPKALGGTFNKRMAAITNATSVPWMATPKITYLEEVTPWRYCTWSRKVELLEAEASDSSVTALSPADEFIDV